MTKSSLSFAPFVSRADLFSGRTVRSPHCADTARLVNYCLAFGGMAVPFHRVMQQITHDPFSVPDSTEEFEFRIRRRERCKYRVWEICAISLDSVASAEFTLAGAPAVSRSLPINAVNPTSRIVLVEDVGTQADTVEDVTLAIEATENEVMVVSIGCYELPRGALEEDATDLGTESTNLVTTRPVVGSMLENVQDASKARTTSPRNGLFYWSRPEGVDVTNTSYANFFAGPFPVIPPRYDRSLTSNALVRMSVYGQGVASGSLDFRLTTDSSAYTGSISGASKAWSSEVNVTQRDEDPTRDNGVQSGQTGLGTFALKKTGTGTAKIYAVAVYMDT